MVLMIPEQLCPILSAGYFAGGSTQPLMDIGCRAKCPMFDKEAKCCSVLAISRSLRRLKSLPKNVDISLIKIGRDT